MSSYSAGYAPSSVKGMWNPRDRLMLELMARGAMRVGEVLKLRPHDLRRHAATYASRAGPPKIPEYGIDYTSSQLPCLPDTASDEAGADTCLYVDPVY